MLNQLEAIHRDGAYFILIEYLMGQTYVQPYEYEATWATLQYFWQSHPSLLLTDALNEALGKIPSIFHGMATHEMTRVDDIAVFLPLSSATPTMKNHFFGVCPVTSESSVSGGPEICGEELRPWNGSLDTSVVLWYLADAVISEDRNSRYRTGHIKTATYESTLAVVVQSGYDEPAIVALLKTLVVESLLRKSNYTAGAELFVCNPSNGALDSELRKKLENLISGWTDVVAKDNHSSSGMVVKELRGQEVFQTPPAVLAYDDKSTNSIQSSEAL
ncbi:hypothetical protein FB451DRAFT_1172243 [Mycena latifolia]|nr:hypothetical protein FB451DRAFT_1178715 [Mycena latifolia]KAJ7479124.1 hypothetical protein FB451DRAFT_1172243 [Mycena latifolia]